MVTKEEYERRKKETREANMLTVPTESGVSLRMKRISPLVLSALLVRGGVTSHLATPKDVDVLKMSPEAAAEMNQRIILEVQEKLPEISEVIFPRCLDDELDPKDVDETDRWGATLEYVIKLMTSPVPASEEVIDKFRQLGNGT